MGRKCNQFILNATENVWNLSGGQTFRVKARWRKTNGCEAVAPNRLLSTIDSSLEPDRHAGA